MRPQSRLLNDVCVSIFVSLIVQEFGIDLLSLFQRSYTHLRVGASSLVAVRDVPILLVEAVQQIFAFKGQV